jgi:hypothetical protein
VPECKRGHDLTIRGVYKNGFCKECSKFCHRRYYSECKSYLIKKTKARIERNRNLVIQAKSKPCSDCQQVYPPWVMQFDHLKDKLFHLAKLAYTQYSEQTINKEIAKCDVVCANCHAIRTHKRRLSCLISNPVLEKV